MATIRKPKRYKDGGRVTSADLLEPTSDVNVVLEEEPAIADLLEPEPDPETDDAVMNSVRATVRAEELQRQQQPQTIEQHIDRMPVSDRRKQFLKQNTLLLDPKNATPIEHYWKEGLDLGLDPDSAEQDEHVVRRLRAYLEGERQRGVDAANAASIAMREPPAPEPSIDQEAERLEHDASSARDMLDAMGSTPAAIAAEIAPEQPAPPPRSSVRGPISAPVSRSIPSASGPRQDLKNIVLSAEERLVARNSFGVGDTSMTNEEREMIYARNKARMLAMKSRGEIQ